MRKKSISCNKGGVFIYRIHELSMTNEGLPPILMKLGVQQLASMC